MMVAKTPPLLSIVMPMYNAERYIELAVEALLQQTFEDFELIVVDDGSTDMSPAMIDRMAEEDARIRVIHLSKNAGSANANNHGLQEARGEFIAYTDADDISHPEKLAKQVDFLQENPGIGMVATSYWKIGPEGEILRKTRNALHNAVLKFHLLFAVPVCHPTIMYRKEVLKTLLPQPYNPEQKAGADFDMFTKMARVCKMAVLPDYLFYYRVHAGGVSKAKKQVATEGMLKSALAEIGLQMPSLLPEMGKIERFIRIQRVDGSLTVGMMRDYFEGLELLRAAYVRKLDKVDAKRVNRFCVELAVKTLVGRYKLYRKPVMALRFGLCGGFWRLVLAAV